MFSIFSSGSRSRDTLNPHRFLVLLWVHVFIQHWVFDEWRITIVCSRQLTEREGLKLIGPSRLRSPQGRIILHFEGVDIEQIVVIVMSSQTNLRPLSVKDRVELLSRWFKEWNHCEQTLALYSLLRRVSPTQARFLSYVLTQKLKNEVAGIEQVEAEANSSGLKCNACYRVMV